MFFSKQLLIDEIQHLAASHASLQPAGFDCPYGVER